jgi:hypothetical protein
MIRRHPVGVLVVFLMLAGFGLSAVGCSDNPVGRKCDLGTATPQAGEVVVASPSLDCVSRTCLRVPGSRTPPPGNNYTGGLCTAECSADSDCDRVPESPCILGFSCGIAVTAGPFCCRKFCICKDYIVVPDSGQLATPAACEVGNDQADCCNLPGRAGNPKYPLCKA